MNMAGFNVTQYERTSRELNKLLRRIESSEGLSVAIKTLERQQCDMAFIQHDPRTIPRWPLIDPADPQRRLSAQFNPHRARRPTAGAVVEQARRDVGCALCRRHLMCQQHYREFGFGLVLAGGTAWAAWMNPFPLMPSHFILASEEHLPQAWIADSPGMSGRNLTELLASLLDALGRLPGFVGFHNSPGAGASQPHLHLQLFERPAAGCVFPLEQAAESTDESEREGERGTLIAGDYPVSAMCFRGKRDAVIEAATDWAVGWLDQHRSTMPSLSANIIASADENQAGTFRLFVVPRSKLFERVPMLSGMPASLEILGELVLSSESERQLLDTGQLNYHSAWQMLAAVDTPGLPRPAARRVTH